MKKHRKTCLRMLALGICAVLVCVVQISFHDTAFAATRGKKAKRAPEVKKTPPAPKSKRLSLRERQKRHADVDEEAAAAVTTEQKMQSEEVSTICIEAQSGLVISEHNADRRRPAASMVKMMQFLLVADGLHDGSLRLDSPVTVAEQAQEMGGTQVYLEAGEEFPLGDLMSAVAVASANDAAMAVACGVFGGKEAYLQRVNEKAASIGMKDSSFRSVHGLPPDKGELPDDTTARDMARAAQFCVLEPQIMKWVGSKELQFRPNQVTKFNTNKLLWNMDGCDGLKTGFTRQAGFCLTATAVRDGIRLIGVVMGADAKRDRFDIAKELLEEGFSQVSRRKVIAKGEPIGKPVAVANCETPRVQLTAADELWVVVKNSDAASIEKTPELPTVVQPPAQKGTTVGKVRVQLAGKELGSVDVTLPTDLQEASWRWKLMRTLTPWRQQ